MLSLRLDHDIEEQLKELSRLTGTSKTAIARQAIIHYLEDLDDYRDAVAILQRHESTISLAELERELDLAH
jgi:predicted DNA-binding protein